MTEESLYRRQVSKQHLDMLAQFMEEHRPLALASARSRVDLVQSKRMWEKIARTLNKIDANVTRSGKSWARYWINLKFKVRHKYMCMKRCQTEGTYCGVRLNTFEERIIKVLTDEDGNLLPLNSAHNLYKHAENGEKCSRNSAQQLKGTDQSITRDDRLYDSGKEDIPDDTDSLEDFLHSKKKGACRTEMVNIIEPDVKPNITSRLDLQDPIEVTQRSTEDLKRELLEFELRKQKELFEIEKKERREKHELEVAILRLKRQVLEKELKS